MYKSLPEPTAGFFVKKISHQQKIIFTILQPFGTIRLATKTEVETKANINAIPTKTSQLTNDSDFTTGADLQSLGAEFGSQIQAMGTQNAQSFSNLEAKIPTKTSQLTNDSDFITSTVVGEAFQSFAEDIGKSFVTLDVFNAKIEEIQALIDGHHPQV